MLNILKGASKGEFDVILAWRENRLYRGLWPALVVLLSLAKENSRLKNAGSLTYEYEIEIFKKLAVDLIEDGIYICISCTAISLSKDIVW
jgi:hypothetical protein